MALKLKNEYEYQSPTFRKILAAGKLQATIDSLLRLLSSPGFQLDTYEFHSPIFERVLAEGQHEAKLDTLLLLLSARGLHPDDATRARLQACDGSELDALLLRANTIEKLGELLGP